MTDIRSLERNLLDNLPWNKASIKFLARFLPALYDMWTVNCAIVDGYMVFSAAPFKNKSERKKPGG